MLTTRPTLTQIQSQMIIEARRDFLLEHAKYFSQLLIHWNNQTFQKYSNIDWEKLAAPATEQMNKELETLLCDMQKKAKVIQDKNIVAAVKSLDLVLLQKSYNDGGISKDVGKHLHQLHLQDRTSYIQLQQEGFVFYWDKETAQNIFYELLQACGVKANKTYGQAPSDENYQEACFAVIVSHLDVEKILSLCQIHAYSLKETLYQLYQAKGLNQAACLTQAANHESCNAVTSATVLNTAQMNFDDQNDIVSVKLTALPDMVKHQEPHHVVILLDDSGSMGGTRMTAANDAVRQFVERLPDDTLISLQPFNAKTQLFRESVEKIKKKSDVEKEEIFNVSATGDTPTKEILVGSAVFLRKNGQDYLISKAALNNTTIVMLTDGDANGTAQDIVKMMQTSNTLERLSYNNFNYKNKPLQVTASYGVDRFACSQLPSFFFIAISEGANRKFIEEIGDELHSAHAFVDDTGKNMQSQIDSAFELLTHIKERVPLVFVSLSYTHPITGERKILGKDMRNLYCGASREMEFLIPKNASNVRVSLLVDGQCSQYHVNSSFLNKYTPEYHQAVLSNYISDQFFAIRTQYQATFFELRNKLSNVNSGAIEDLSFVAEQSRFSKLEELTIPDPKVEHKEINDWNIYFYENLESVKTEEINNAIILVGKDKNKKQVYYVNNHQLLCNENEERREKKKLVSIHLKLPSFGIGIEVRNGKVEKTKQTQAVMNQILNVFLDNLDVFNANKKNQGTREITIQNIKMLTNETSSKINDLIKVCTQHSTSENTLVKDMELFIHAITSEQVINGKNVYTQAMNIDNTENNKNFRIAAAKYTQTRVVGKPLEKNEVSSLTITQEAQIFIYMDNGDYHAALDLIKQNPDELNQKQFFNTYHATPLIYALVRLNEIKDITKKDELRNIILGMIKCHQQITLRNADAMGNTALHRAVWYGEFEIAKELILLAKHNNELEKIKQCRNQIMVGATRGETFLDLIHKVNDSVLSNNQKRELLALTMGDLVDEQIFTVIEKGDAASINTMIMLNPGLLNQHDIEKNGNSTPLFAMLYHMKQGHYTKDVFEQMHQLLITILQNDGAKINFLEGNKDGNTLLHYAFSNGFLDIAEEIVNQAEKHKQLSDLLKARNCLSDGAGYAGETVAMNFVNLYKMTCDNLTLVCGKVEPKNTIDMRSMDNDARDALLLRVNHYSRCAMLYDKIQPLLSETQQAEMNHLALIHKKVKQGYSGYYWLKAAPMLELEKLMEACKNQAANLSTHVFAAGNSVESINQLLKFLDQLRQGQIPYSAVVKYTDEMIQKIQTNDNNKKEVLDLLRKVQVVLTQYALFAHLEVPLSFMQHNPLIPKPLFMSIDPKNGITLYFDSKAQAEVFYSQISSEFQSYFIKTPSMTPYTSEILIKNSVNEGFGVYPGKNKDIGLNCGTTEFRRFLFNLLDLHNINGVIVGRSAQESFAAGGNGIDRSNAIYFQNPGVFKSPLYVNKHCESKAQTRLSSSKREEEPRHKENCAIM